MMKTIKLLSFGILLLTQLAGCLQNNGTTVPLSKSTRISYDGSTGPATLTQANSAALLAGAYEGGKAGTALGSTASLSTQNSSPSHPRTFLLSEVLDNAVQQALQNGGLTPANAAAVSDISNQVPGNCGGKMSYSGTLDDQTREFYITLTFSDYCDGDTATPNTLNGSATASGQTTNNANIDPAFQNAINPYGLDMFNNPTLAPNPFSVTFDALTVSTGGSTFTANGYALITKKDELDPDESPDTNASSEPINPDNTPDADNSPTDSNYPDDQAQVDEGGSTTIQLDYLLRDDSTKLVYKFENFNISLTNGSGYVDADITGRYFDPSQGYLEISTPTPLRIVGTDYWPTSGILKGVGNNDAAAFTALSNTSYQLDIDSNNDGTPDVTTTGAWSNL
ncbi:MAG: hypothetical protein P8164_07990 [Gammaproteobacteria bacterium]|jgi:hypothetical protein